MAAESSREPGEGRIESLIDELISEILNESGASPESPVRGVATTAALFEAAFGSAREAARTSALERILLADAFAAELADSLAPALAEQLAPRLLKALEHLAHEEAGGRKPAPAARSGNGGRKPGAK